MKGALELAIVMLYSVVSAQADVFAKRLSKIGRILRIFDKLDESKANVSSTKVKQSNQPIASYFTC